jgi:transglutaminase-like putative cysteine protease
MRIRIGYDLIFNLPSPTPMLAMLLAHPDRGFDLERLETLFVEPFAPVNLFIDSFGNRCGRLVAPPGTVRFHYDNVCRDSGMPDEVPFNARQFHINELPDAVLPFLLASRYCEVDRMLNLAWQLFGQYPEGWPRVKAVCDWVHDNVQFGYQFARATKTAWEVYEERKGVCRDFMHLSITFLRALNIPCRYATGYLGDIGVPRVPMPMDFSAWFEVYLGGRWWTQDARHNVPRIGRILMARGRDAVDVALVTSFGPHTLERFSVVTDELR